MIGVDSICKGVCYITDRDMNLHCDKQVQQHNVMKLLANSDEQKPIMSVLSSSPTSNSREWTVQMCFIFRVRNKINAFDGYDQKWLNWLQLVLVYLFYLLPRRGYSPAWATQRLSCRLKDGASTWLFWTDKNRSPGITTDLQITEMYWTLTKIKFLFRLLRPCEKLESVEDSLVCYMTRGGKMDSIYSKSSLRGHYE